MSTELREIYARIVRLRKILHRAIKALAVLDGITEFSEAHSNRDDYLRPSNEHKMLLRAYSEFFDPTREALLLDAHTQLAKLLVDNDDSLHIKRLVRHARSQDKKIEKSQKNPDFEESIADFALWYSKLSAEDLDHIAVLFEANEWLISKLELVRNKRLSHENLREIPAQMLTLEELRTLTDLSEEVLNKLGSIMGHHDENRYEIEHAKRETILMLERLYTTF